MKIQVYNQEDAAKIKAYFQEVLKEAGIKNRTNSLYEPKITWEPSTNGGTWSIDFEQYGLYLDKGVMGVKGGKASSSPFRMRSKGIFKALSGKMANRQIGAIYWWGIKPYPWQEKFLKNIDEILALQIEEGLVRDIEEAVSEIPPSTLKITL